MWKTLLACAFVVSCIPADPGPTYYPPQQQWGHQQPPPPQQPPYQQPPPPQQPPYQQPPQQPPQPPPVVVQPPPPQDNWRFDSRGWTLLGTTTVDGARDRDVIAVGKYQGRFDELTMVVYDNDLRLDGFVVTFGNNETFAPSIKHYFKESSRSAAIDLPGDDRHIKTIDLAYSSLGRGVQARVEIYGRDTGKPKPPKPPKQDDWKFDARGWTLLGSETVDGRRDHDTIAVGKYTGRFDQLTMVVYDSDLQLDSFVVTFGNNETFSVDKIKHVFKENSRAKAIDLPGDDRRIKAIDLGYSNLPGGGKARVEIYGRDTGKPKPPKQDDWKFDSRGWTLLGSETVNGRKDRDTIEVGKYTGRFDQLTMVVYDSDLQLDSFVVTFGNNETFSVDKIKYVFKENSRAKAIDLPGDDRVIKSIELGYSNLPGGGKARVEIYGRDTGKARPQQPPANPPPPPPPTTGGNADFVSLGTVVVDGKRDRDTVTVNDGKGGRRAVMLRASGGDIEIADVILTFHSKKTQSLGKFTLTTKAPDFTFELGEPRKIDSIVIVYAGPPKSGTPTIEVLARDKKAK